ncbi:hypothetical protein PQX77_002377 [Marasmius sp. AFHP31]|nr:hypothetical protein PQX77_002377 [Marasmius sp. AFHP31]
MPLFFNIDLLATEGFAEVFFFMRPQRSAKKLPIEVSHPLPVGTNSALDKSRVAVPSAIEFLRDICHGGTELPDYSSDAGTHATLQDQDLLPDQLPTPPVVEDETLPLHDDPLMDYQELQRSSGALEAELTRLHVENVELRGAMRRLQEVDGPMVSQSLRDNLSLCNITIQPDEIPRLIDIAERSVNSTAGPVLGVLASMVVEHSSAMMNLGREVDVPDPSMAARV